MAEREVRKPYEQECAEAVEEAAADLLSMFGQYEWGTGSLLAFCKRLEALYGEARTLGFHDG